MFVVIVYYDGRGDGGTQLYYVANAKTKEEAIKQFALYQGYDPEEDSVEYEAYLESLRQGEGAGDFVEFTEASLI